MDWLKKDNEYIWHPYTSLQGVDDPILVESAKGVYLHTADGRKILDAVSSWWVNIHGHCNDYIADAIARQARTLEHVIFAGFTHKPAIELGERLLQLLPGNQKKIFYSDNGSTAVEVAIKMAVQYWYNKGVSKNKIIAIEGSYHGDTFGAMSVAERSAFSKPFHSMLFDVSFIEFPTLEKEQDVLVQFQELVKQGDVAAFIYEPLVQGTAGMRIYRPELLERLLEIAKEHHVICIADEVMTGFGRTGKIFASDYMKIGPDIICLSKGITGGFMALGATTCNSKVLEPFLTEEKLKTFFHGHSYTANPLTCAAANASLDILLSEECSSQLEMISKSHGAFADQLKSVKGVRKVQNIGTILSVEIQTEQGTNYFNNLRNYLYNSFLEKNILLRPLGNVIYIFPPFVIEKQELELVYSAIQEVLEKLY